MTRSFRLPSVNRCWVAMEGGGGQRPQRRSGTPSGTPSGRTRRVMRHSRRQTAEVRLTGPAVDLRGSSPPPNLLRPHASSSQRVSNPVSGRSAAEEAPGGGDSRSRSQPPRWALSEPNSATGTLTAPRRSPLLHHHHADATGRYSRLVPTTSER